MQSDEEESKTEGSTLLVVRGSVEEKPLTIFGTIASRIIFQQKKEETMKVIELLKGDTTSEPKNLDLLLLTFNKETNLQEALELIDIEL